MSILVVGSVALDTIKTPLGREREVLGGSASYFSVAASQFSPVSLVAVVGRDFPQKHLAFLQAKGIDIKGLDVKDGNTFRWEGWYGDDLGDPVTVATHLNVFADFLPKIPDNYQDNEYIFLANIDPELQNNVLDQVEKPKLGACDTMNHWIGQKPKALLELLKKVDIFFLNLSEAKELTRENNIVKMAKKIKQLGPKVVVIKKGQHGSLLFSENDIFSLPGFLLESVVDPTGAGDTFAGGFIGYLAKCRKLNPVSLRRAAVYGSLMATFAVEDFSLKSLSSVTKVDIKKRLSQYKKLTNF